jgi:hypothetical protein
MRSRWNLAILAIGSFAITDSFFALPGFLN